MQPMKNILALFVALASVSAFSAEISRDIVIYGSSPAAISAAIQAKRMGKSAVVVSPETRIGGLTTGGLGQTDIGNKAAFGGIALEFYKAVAAHYANSASWKWQKPESYFPDGLSGSPCHVSRGRIQPGCRLGAHVVLPGGGGSRWVAAVADFPACGVE